MSLTLLAAAPLVLDDVLVVQGLEDLDFPLPGAQELGAAPGFQGFHCHHLARAVVGGVVAAQAHLPEVALENEGFFFLEIWVEKMRFWGLAVPGEITGVNKF